VPTDKQNRSVRCAERNCLTAHSDIYRPDASALTWPIEQLIQLPPTSLQPDHTINLQYRPRSFQKFTCSLYQPYTTYSPPRKTVKVTVGYRLNNWSFRLLFLQINQLDALISQIYFWNETLPVSDSYSVHHQKFLTVHTAKLYDIYHCCVYSLKLLMIDRGTVRNM
jgi:hypothetical protein